MPFRQGLLIGVELTFIRISTEIRSYEGTKLDMRYARKALEHVHTLWGRPVHLETIIDDESTVLRYDGEEHQEN